MSKSATCDRHETGPGNETCPDCLFAMLIETRRALNESESRAESQEREVDRLRSHVSRLEAEVRDEKRRAEYAEEEAGNLKQNLAGTDELLKTVLDEKIALEESLRVALEARAEAVEVLGEVAPALDYCIEELEAFGWLDKDEHVRAARRRLARAIGKGE